MMIQSVKVHLFAEARIVPMKQQEIAVLGPATMTMIA